MPTTFQLRAWTRFLAAPEAVWAHKTDPEKLGAEFRPWFGFRADAEALSRALAGAAPADVAARLLPLGLPPGLAWPVHVRTASPPVSFTDTSTNALYSRFEHVHTVEPTCDGARYLDVVTFVPRALPKVVAIVTERLFAHRHQVSARGLPADKQATGVTVLRVLDEMELEAEGTMPA